MDIHTIYKQIHIILDFPHGSVVKNTSINAGEEIDESLIPGLGRSPEGRNGNPLQSLCLEKFMDRGA